MVNFLRTLFLWPNGIVVGNLIASMIWALPTWFLLLRKFHCSQPMCFRPGVHQVRGTTFRTCQKHTTSAVHAKLTERHAGRYPDQHAHLND